MTILYSRFFRWGLFIVSIVLPFIAWAGYYNWQLGSLTIYQIYPLLGITAFMIMSTHFYISALNTKINIPNDTLLSHTNYLVVLGLILLHPMLLYYQLLKDGLGLPPFSSIEFVGESLAVFIFLGSFGLILFLFYELARQLKNKAVFSNNWLWVIISQYVAMLAIFIHAWGLGGITQSGWFKYVWIITAIGVLATIFYIIPNELAKQRLPSKS